MVVTIIGGGDCSPPHDTLCVDQIMIYKLHRSVPDVVHPLRPQHLILRLELLSDTLTGGHLFYQLKKHVFRLIVQIGKIPVQLAGDLQPCVQRLAVLSEMPQVPLAPNADGAPTFIGELQRGNILIIRQPVAKPALLVCNARFHDVILQIRLISAIQSFWLITKAPREAASLRSASLGTPLYLRVILRFHIILQFRRACGAW